MTNRHHGIGYIEFQTSDMDASKTFGSDVFGWTFTDDASGRTSVDNL